MIMNAFGSTSGYYPVHFSYLKKIWHSDYILNLARAVRNCAGRSGFARAQYVRHALDFQKLMILTVSVWGEDLRGKIKNQS